MIPALLRSIRSLFSLQGKGFLLFLLFLSPSLAFFSGEDDAQVERFSASEFLLDSGPAPAILPDPPAPEITPVRNPQTPSEETALRKRARQVADRYTLSNNVLFQHILARHGFDAKVPGKSRFVKGFDVREGIDYVLKSPDARIRENTEGRRGYIFEVTYRTRVGISPERKPLRTLRVVIDQAGHVVTAFPVK